MAADVKRDKVSNLHGTQQTADVVLRTLPGSLAQARALFPTQNFPLSIAAGETHLCVSLAPWDTEVFKISFMQ